MPTSYDAPILTLPPELQCEIFRGLDWKSLIAVRTTCTSLYAISRSRDLWLRFVREFESRPGFSRIELPYTEVSVEAMEKWVSRRFRVDEFWAGGSLKYWTPDVRSFKTLPIQHVKVLPGGRWMLGMHGGKLYAYDLERLELPGKVIVDPGCYDEEISNGYDNTLDMWGYWMDTEGPRLAFRVAICKGALVIPRGARIRFYHVQISEDGLDLVSNYMRTMGSLHDGAHYKAALSEKYFVEFRKATLRNEVARLCMFKYSMNNLNDSPLPADCEEAIVQINVPGAEIVAAHILWNDRIVLLLPSSIEIYLFNQFRRASNGQIVTPPYRISRQCRMVSEPSFFPDAVRFTINMKRQITGIQIPRDANKAPLVIGQDSHTGDSLYAAMGLYNSMIFIGDLSMELVGHSWIDFPMSWRHSGSGTFYTGSEAVYWQMVGYSEELARAVIYDWGRLKIVECIALS